jgi:hypothetical protein
MTLSQLVVPDRGASRPVVPRQVVTAARCVRGIALTVAFVLLVGVAALEAFDARYGQAAAPQLRLKSSVDWPHAPQTSRPTGGPTPADGRGGDAGAQGRR